MVKIKRIWENRNNVIYRGVILNGEKIFTKTQLESWA